MSDPRRSADQALDILKDFQRRTVDYVFNRLWLDDDPAHRFLVADEVGLGKTLVARGIVARTLEHLWDRVGRIDIVYICSNQSIARQNVRRLSVEGLPHAVLPSRLTLLPAHVRNLNAHKVNFISLTPSTSLNTTRANRGGVIEERLVLWQMLKRLSHPRGRPAMAWTRPTKPPRTTDHQPIRTLPRIAPALNRRGLCRLLQCGVGDKSYRSHMRWNLPTVDNGLTDAFLARLLEDGKLYRTLVDFCEAFARGEWCDQYWMVGQLRGMLAGVCIRALEPDLIILDEFQRFRSLLDSKSPAAHLTRQLLDFQYDRDAPEAGLRTRVLLLSATPYKMLTLYGEDGEDHYADFLRTCRFLCENDEETMRGLRAAIRRYRLGLLDGAAGNVEMEEARRDLEGRLLRHMVRTERVRATADSDAMLRGRPSEPELRPEDLLQARTVHRVAASLNARDPIQYWKSAPFLLNVMRDYYKLKERLRDRVADPPPGLTEAVRDGDASLLKREAVERYAPIEPANPRLRQLLDETVGQGQWKWLWMPPALPYLEPGGPYAGAAQTTKALVFSSWNVVPDAIAALCSYEVNRLMLERESGRTDHPAYSELHRSRARLLDFPMGRDSGEPRHGEDSARRDRPGAMNILPLFYPSPSLSEAGDPLSLAAESGIPVTTREALEAVMERLRQRFRDAGVVVRADASSEVRVGQTDQRWYWAAPAMLDRVLHPGVRDWVRAEDGWPSATSGGAENWGFRRHVAEFGRAMAGQPNLGEPMGTPPEDLFQVLALVALAGPGVCAHRALRRIVDIPPTSPALLAGASRIAHGLRGTFNMPECISLVRAFDDELKERTAKTPRPPRDHHTRYWELVLRYALAGNLQAVLDEYAHVLEESLGLMGHTATDRVVGISKEMVEALSIRTSQVRIDDIRCAGPGTPIKMSPFNMRTRFALRFGDLQSERGESVQRADTVRKAFNSPFRPFILATTSIGQEGLDFHTYCHAVYHWNLPRNPVDLEQREGRVHRYKGHAVRKNVAERYGGDAYQSACKGGVNAARDPWKVLFRRARDERPPDSSDLVPYWIFEDGDARVERRVPMPPFSSEVDQLRRLLGSLAVYRLAFGQPRQEDLVEYLRRVRHKDADAVDLNRFRISLRPPRVT